jgi:cytochrome c5
VSSAQYETFSPHNIAVLGGLLLLALFLGEVVFNPLGKAGMSKPADTIEDIAMRLMPVVSLDIMRNSTSAAAAGGTASKSPDQLYQGACQACHATGAAGAPKLGDEAAWVERVAKGLDGLIEAAINGVGGMPPRGGSQYNDQQMRAVVEYMAAESNEEMRNTIKAAPTENADDSAAATDDSAAESTASKSPDQLYQGACQACHATGVAGAPKLGDAVAWSERISKGVEALVASAISGVGTMPPRGGSQYSDEQIQAVVEYIVAESK